MFLTKFEINTARRGARFLLGNPQAMHAAVLSSFPPPPLGQENPRVLWRVDRAEHRVSLYVVSPAEPDMSALNEQAGWATNTWATREYEPLLRRLEEGQLWSFRLHANPTKQSMDPATKGKRFAHVTPKQQMQWLLDRAERRGFHVEMSGDAGPVLEVSSRTKDSFGRRDPNQEGRESAVTLVRVQFDGLLRVTDVGRFRETLVQGVGRGKAYGCGLMTIASADGRPS
ncbi:type I-E CRISPR-associated protein Cas6/Cse3/CasE [Arthrobacter sp. Y-9]|uniref:type I-E CRISPR-associated protein Cas6/Cse3/CasE n=1 Tax=Arthrobacter sp. Y-9 TaxID=3039385 RepID=UPI00241FE185|nr:type I-E CRISPR-associated protein Cas6/Cse3/CasE [Arthrobacter sp. Y-9]WFR83728.1 type I-E CRISPR-associated protein Cas6/Cse3/CasE [Arthrobacter sp. Y-9]